MLCEAARVLPRVLDVAAVVAVLAALVIAAGNVENSDGAICGSAWRSANRTLSTEGGDRTDAERVAAADDCERAGERALRWALVAGVAGVVATGGARYARRRWVSDRADGGPCYARPLSPED